MLIFFGIINQQESIMTERDALVAIHTVFGTAEGNLTNGGFELSSHEYSLLRAILKSALKNESEIKNVQD
jgi:hypothetical protein